MLVTHAAAILAHIDTGRQVTHQSVDNDLLGFQTKRGPRLLYVPAPLRTELARNAHGHAFVEHNEAENIEEQSLGPSSGRGCSGRGLRAYLPRLPAVEASQYSKLWSSTRPSCPRTGLDRNHRGSQRQSP